MLAQCKAVQGSRVTKVKFCEFPKEVKTPSQPPRQVTSTHFHGRSTNRARASPFALANWVSRAIPIRSKTCRHIAWRLRFNLCNPGALYNGAVADDGFYTNLTELASKRARVTSVCTVHSSYCTYAEPIDFRRWGDVMRTDEKTRPMFLPSRASFQGPS
jgi:hypothetical protein